MSSPLRFLGNVFWQFLGRSFRKSDFAGGSENGSDLHLVTEGSNSALCVIVGLAAATPTPLS